MANLKKSSKQVSLPPHEVITPFNNIFDHGIKMIHKDETVTLLCLFILLDNFSGNNKSIPHHTIVMKYAICAQQSDHLQKQQVVLN